jgi:vacuolar-type H+-ATPase subunit E/Vma4
LAEAETRGHREWLWARERLLANVLARVETQLAASPVRPDTAEQLARLVDEALAVLPREPLCVRVAANYAALVDAALKARGAGGRPYRVDAAASVTGRRATATIAGGGVIVETEDGRLCFDNSFATRIRRQHDELRGAAAAILFAE